MLHDVTRDWYAWRTVPDYKRTYRTRRWRKLRHLARIAPAVRALGRAPGVFVWDDLSLLLFTPAMRASTVFVLHHYDPLEHDPPRVEAALWERLFAVLPECAAVVCVAPYWARFLQGRGVPGARVIYNAFDLTEIDRARGLDRLRCRAEFGLAGDTLAVYAGKAGRWKGVETVAAALDGDPRLRVITTGPATHTVGFTGAHHDLPRDGYLRLLRACDVGVFTPRMEEGWSRCAAEALLTGLPGLIRPVAGLGDLAQLTAQPAPDLARLREQVYERAATPTADTRAVYDTLARFDRGYFAGAWRRLLDGIAV
ncbi:glycosyltransferase [Streptomyces sp. NPDC051554]|uniref:glycosyltransferase n=1 Tax=Streptomyces sp. NPDC051554 TaxID=3365656 RepID=UPI00379B13A2